MSLQERPSAPAHQHQRYIRDIRGEGLGQGRGLLCGHRCCDHHMQGVAGVTQMLNTQDSHKERLVKMPITAYEGTSCDVWV